MKIQLVMLLLVASSIAPLPAAAQHECEALFRIDSQPWTPGDASVALLQGGQVVQESTVPRANFDQNRQLRLDHGLQRGVATTLRVVADGHEATKTQTLPASGDCAIIYGGMAPPNRKPAVTIAFESAAFTDTNDLTAFVTISDADGDTTGTPSRQWSRIRDGTETILLGQTGTTLPAAGFSAGDYVKLTVDVADEHGGRRVTSDRVRVGTANDLPVPSFNVVRAGEVVPGKLVPGTYSLDASGSSDGPGGTPTAAQDLRHAWEWDGDRGFDESAQIVATVEFTSRGAHQVRLQAKDAEDYLGRITKDLWVNQLPVAQLTGGLGPLSRNGPAPTAQIALSDPDNNDPAHPFAADALTYTYAWHAGNGPACTVAEQIATASGSTASSPPAIGQADIPAKGRCLVLLVTPHDGVENGETGTLSTIIGNAPPTIASASMGPVGARDDQALAATFVAGDLDGDSRTCTVEWLKAGVLQPALTQAGIPCTTQANATLAATHTAKADAWRFRVTADDGDGGSVQATSGELVITAAASQIVIAGPSSLVAGAVGTGFTVNVVDAQGDPTTVAARTTFALSTSTGTGVFLGADGSPLAADEIVIPAGGQSASFSYQDIRASAATLTATGGDGDGRLTGKTAIYNVAVAAGAADRLRFDAIPGGDVAAGDVFTVSVQLVDRHGNLVTTDSTISLSVTSGPGGALAATGGLTRSTQSGQVTFGDLILEQAGAYALTATSNLGVTAATGANVNVVAASPARYAIVVQTTAAVAGQVVELTAQLRDAHGNPVAAAGRAVSWTKDQGAGEFSVRAGRTDAAGKATTNLTIGTTAGQIYRVNIADSLGVGGSSEPINSNPGAPVQIVLTAATDDLVSGTTREMAIELRDAHGNIATAGPSQAILLRHESGAGTVAGLTTVATTQGRALVTVTGQAAGSFTVEATGTGLTSSSVSLRIREAPPTVIITGPAENLWQPSSHVVLAYSTAGPVATVVCRVNGITVTGGSNSCSATLGDGTHNFIVDVTGPGGAMVASRLVHVDTTPPALSVVPSRGPDQASWYTAPVTFSAVASDTGSGLASCTPATEYAGPSGDGRTVALVCADKAGNQVTAASDPFKYDDLAPTVSVTAPAWIGENGGTATFHVADVGSGVQTYEPQYRIDQGDWQLLPGTGSSRAIPTAPDGAVIEFRASAVDVLGHARDLPAQPDATTRIDHSPPETPGGLEAQGGEDGAFRLFWSVPASQGAPPQRYTVQHRAPGGAVSTHASTISMGFSVGVAAEAGSIHEFRVAATDAAGNQGPFSEWTRAFAFDLTVADVAANNVVVNWASPTIGGLAGAIGRYEVRVHTAAITPINWAQATLAANAPLTRPSGGLESFTITGLKGNEAYYFAVRVVYIGGLAGPVSNVLEITTGDDTPPVGRPTIASATHPSGAATFHDDPRFSWASVSDGESPVRYHYAIRASADYKVGPADANTTGVRLALENQPQGTWYLHVVGISDGGLGDRASYQFVVANVTGPQLRQYVDATQVSVERVGEDNSVVWRLAANPPAPVLGVQLWASNSPYVMVIEILATEPAFTSGRFVHRGADAGESTGYLVTPFFGKTVSLGHFSGVDSDVPSETEFLAIHTVDDAGLPGWIWPAVAGILVVAAGIAVRTRVRRKDATSAEVEDHERELGHPAWIGTD